MWTQRDQIQAYQFLRRRLVSALVSADANHPVSPSRRLVVGTVLGLIATVVVTAAFGILGLLHPSAGTDWKKPGQVVIEKETGSRFVVAGDGLLHPVLNFASARLLAGGDGNKTSTVGAHQLAALGRGLPLGIPGAPDSVPAAGRVSTGPLTVCSQLPADQPADAPATTVLRWGAPVAGRALTGGQALLVDDGRGQQVVSAGYRFRIPGAGQAAALGLSGQPVTRVSSAWLSAVPAGSDLDFIGVNGAGQPGPRPASGTPGGPPLRVGEVLAVPDPTAPLAAAGAEFYLVLQAGIAPVSAVQAELALAAPTSRAAGLSGQLRRLSAGQLAGLRQVTLPLPVQGERSLTSAPSVVAPAQQASPICLQVEPSGGQSLGTVLVADPGTDLSAGVPATGTGTLLADRIDVPASTGALVTDGDSTAAPNTYLITDSGIKFPLVSAAARASLGLGKLTPALLSPALLALLPTGPALDPAAAQRPVASGAR